MKCKICEIDLYYVWYTFESESYCLDCVVPEQSATVNNYFDATKIIVPWPHTIQKEELNWEF